VGDSGSYDGATWSLIVTPQFGDQKRGPSYGIPIRDSGKTTVATVKEDAGDMAFQYSALEYQFLIK
jgi:hypothetical protein